MPKINKNLRSQTKRRIVAMNAARIRYSLQRQQSAPVPPFVVKETKPSKGINTEFQVIVSDLAEFLKRSRKAKYGQKNFIEEDSSEMDIEEPSTMSTMSTMASSLATQISQMKDMQTLKHVKKSPFPIVTDKVIAEIDSSKTYVDSMSIENSQNTLTDLFNADRMSIEMSEIGHASEIFEDTQDRNPETWEPEKPQFDIIGSRILEIHKVWSFIETFSDHCFRCLVKPLFVREYRCGLYSDFTFKCPKCHQILHLNNSEHLMEKRKEIYAINLQSVLSSLSTGLGYTSMHEIFSLHDVAYMGYQQYKKNEKLLEPEIERRVEKSINENLRAEMRVAETENSFDQGFPAIGCVGDARWSKRSYNHKYTANSATGVLVGVNTKKILYAGIKNKYCCACQRELKKGERKHHTCYKNWSSPSTSMETALIVEGFKELESKGARVMHYIGDQDSSVMRTIHKSFDWGERVSKVDCLNHKIKNFTNFLVDWKKRNQLGRKFTETMIHHYKALIRKLINDKADSPDYFKKHIPITADHVLGEHKECDEFYCTDKYKFPVLKISKAAYDELKGYLVKSIANRVERFKKGATSNLAEAFFSVNAKFDNGKAKNFIQSGGYRLRSLCAVLDWNEGPTWNYDIVRTFLNVNSGTLKSFFSGKQHKFEADRARKKTPEYKAARKRRQYLQAQEKDTNDYGPNADQDDDPPKQENIPKQNEENIPQQNGENPPLQNEENPPQKK